MRFVSNISYKPRFEATGPVQLIPDSVELAGPADLLAKIKEVRTSPVSLQEVATSMKGTIQLDSSALKGLASSTTTISYSLPVEEFTEGLIEIPVELPVSQRSSVLILPGSVKITFIASLSDYPLIKPTDFRAEAEIPLSEMPGKIPVRIRKQPATIRIISIEPEFLDYLIQK